MIHVHGGNNMKNNRNKKNKEDILEEVTEVAETAEVTEVTEVTEANEEQETEKVEIEKKPEKKNYKKQVKTGVVNCQLLNVRTSPYISGQVSRFLKEGDKIEIDDEVNDFYRLKTEGFMTEEFVKKDFITIL